MNAQVRTLLLNAFLDPSSGLIKDTVKVAVDRRVELIQKDIDVLGARKTQIEARPAAERTDMEKAELVGLTKRIAELTAFQAKVKASTGQTS